MDRRLDVPIPARVLPDGLEIRPVTAADHHRIFEAEADAFKDHWGQREWIEADLTRYIRRPRSRHDPVAGRPGTATRSPASSSTACRPPENEALGMNRGWLDRISVRRPWRKRGVASALIASALDASPRAGARHGDARGRCRQPDRGVAGSTRASGSRRSDHGEVLRPGDSRQARGRAWPEPRLSLAREPLPPRRAEGPRRADDRRRVRRLGRQRHGRDHRGRTAGRSAGRSSPRSTAISCSTTGLAPTDASTSSMAGWPS